MKERDETLLRESYQEAFGTGPTEGNLVYWKEWFLDHPTKIGIGENKKLVAKLVGWHKDYMAKDTADSRRTRKETVTRSYMAIFKTKPSAANMKYWLSEPVYSFKELTAFHKKWIKENW
jgi:hypothetical protein